MPWLHIMDNNMHELTINIDHVSVIESWMNDKHTRVWFANETVPLDVALPHETVMDAICKINEKCVRPEKEVNNE